MTNRTILLRAHQCQGRVSKHHRRLRKLMNDVSYPGAFLCPAEHNAISQCYLSQKPSANRSTSCGARSCTTTLCRSSCSSSLHLTRRIPHPFVLNLPSRGSYQSPLYVFLPPAIHNAARTDPIPVVIDFHGGGFFLGPCLEQTPFCAQISRELGAIVLSVDYRLGPFDKFPAAVEDVLYAVLDEKKAWISRTGAGNHTQADSITQHQERRGTR